MEEITLELKRLNKTMAEILLLFQNEVLKDNERRIKYELEKEENDKYEKQLKEKYDNE